MALRHFVADGFEAASVPAIAAEVGVTERTFYRHFATKDEVLFGDVADRLAWFATAMRERPADEDLVRSVLAALGSAPTDPQLLAEIARLRTELLSADRIERTFRDRQGAMATELRTILARARASRDSTPPCTRRSWPARCSPPSRCGPRGRPPTTYDVSATSPSRRSSRSARLSSPRPSAAAGGRWRTAARSRRPDR